MKHLFPLVFLLVGCTEVQPIQQSTEHPEQLEIQSEANTFHYIATLPSPDRPEKSRISWVRDTTNQWYEGTYESGVNDGLEYTLLKGSYGDSTFHMYLFRYQRFHEREIAFNAQLDSNGNLEGMWLRAFERGVLESSSAVRQEYVFFVTQEGYYITFILELPTQIKT
jgi:hypothetical protein